MNWKIMPEQFFGTRFDVLQLTISCNLLKLSFRIFGLPSAYVVGSYNSAVVGRVCPENIGPISSKLPLAGADITCMLWHRSSDHEACTSWIICGRAWIGAVVCREKKCILSLCLNHDPRLWWAPPNPRLCPGSAKRSTYTLYLVSSIWTVLMFTSQTCLAKRLFSIATWKIR